MPTEVSNSTFRLSKTGGATEVMLFAHGAWNTKCGKLFVPNGMVINFYCIHGVFGTKGVPIGENLMGGVDNPIPQSVLATILERKTTEKWSNDRLDQEILLAKATANSGGLGDEMQVVEAVEGKGFGNRQKVYNYALSHDGPHPKDMRAENLWQHHQKAGAAVDLLIMKPGAESDLVGAIKFARSKGEKYQVFHYLPCRYIDNNDVKAMKTMAVDLPGMEGEFIETSVL